MISAHQDVMFKMTKIKLELIPDPDMYAFLEKGIRGGIFYISNRFSKANNEHLKFYEPKQESKQMYFDASNLSDYAMSKNILRSGFKWIDLE